LKYFQGETLKTRRLGRTNHESTIAIFGAAAFYEVSQKQADETMEQVIGSGINHIDVAPSYGQAEERLGPWIETERSRFFLGCKTMKRTREAANNELHHSLEQLRTNLFDLYQFHAVNTMAELDQITGSGGALESVLKARDEGLLANIGITGHGLDVPRIFLEALKRFHFDTVIFPLNFILHANQVYRQAAETLLAECARQDIGVMIIKSIAKGPWGDKQKKNTTWYEPFIDKEWIQKSVHFALSQPITGICTAADVTILPTIIEACESFEPMSIGEQEELISNASQFEPLFT
jgi:predicted aldo/keto reductase-like oxidoreductase